jgi:hypothetical protein
VLQEFELDGQFRCAGSEEFIRWVDAMLGIANDELLWGPDGQFDFRIFDSVEEMAESVRAKASGGYSARLVAGFCWPWSDPDSSDLPTTTKLRPRKLNSISRCGRGHGQMSMSFLTGYPVPAWGLFAFVILPTRELDSLDSASSRILLHGLHKASSARTTMFRTKGARKL